MRTAVTLALALLLGFGIGYRVCYRPASPPTGSETIVTKTTEPPRDAGWAVDSTEQKTQRLIDASFRKARKGDRYADLHVAVEALTAEDFARMARGGEAVKAMFAKLRSFDFDTGHELASALIERWLLTDPNGAVDLPQFLEIFPTECRASALDVLAEKRPVQLLALAEAQKDPEERVANIFRGVQALAFQDPTQAQAWVNRCADLADRRSAETGYRKGVVRADPCRAVELAKQCGNRDEGYGLMLEAAEQAMKVGANEIRRLATQPMEDWMLGSVLEKISEQDPELCADLALHSLAKEGSTELVRPLGSAFTSLARTSLERAMERLSEVPEKHRATAAIAIGREWAATDPEAALDWMARMPPADRVDLHNTAYGSKDTLLMSFGDWAACNQAAAERWAAALPAGDTRNQVYAQMARVLALRGDEAGAIRAFAQAGNASDPKAIENIAQTWTSTDPEAAAEWAAKQPAGNAQNRALASVVGNWANEDPDAVADWLTQFPPGETRDASVVAFLNRVSAGHAASEQLDAEFERWFPLIDDSWNRTRVALHRFWRRNEHDGAGAREWLTNLEKIDRAAVRMTLLQAADLRER